MDFSGVVASVPRFTARTIPGWHYKKVPHSMKKWTMTARALEQEMYEAVSSRISSDSGRLAYRFFDRPQCGEITPEALAEAISDLDLPPPTDEVLAAYFAKMDVDGDGRVSMGDFCRYWQTVPVDYAAQANVRAYQPRTAVREALQDIEDDEANKESMAPDWDFRKLLRTVQTTIMMRTPESSKNRRIAYKLFDEFGEGCIRPNHLRHKLAAWGMAVNDSDVAKLYAYFDKDKDGVVDYNDFSQRTMEWDYPLLADRLTLRTNGDDGAALCAYKRPTTQTESLVNVTVIKHAEEARGREDNPTKSTEMEAAYGFRHHWHKGQAAKGDRSHPSSFTTADLDKRSWVSTGGSSEPIIKPQLAKGAPVRLDPYSGLPLPPPPTDDDYVDQPPQLSRKEELMMNRSFGGSALLLGSSGGSSFGGGRARGSAARVFEERKGRGAAVLGGYQPRSWTNGDKDRGVRPPKTDANFAEFNATANNRLPKPVDQNRTLQHLPLHL